MYKFVDSNTYEVSLINKTIDELYDTLLTIMHPDVRVSKQRITSSYNEHQCQVIFVSGLAYGFDVVRYDFTDKRYVKRETYVLKSTVQVKPEEFDTNSLFIRSVYDQTLDMYHPVIYSANGFVYRDIFNVCLVDTKNKTLSYFEDVYVHESMKSPALEESQHVARALYDRIGTYSVSEYEEIHPDLSKIYKNTIELRHAILNMQNYPFEFMYGRKKAV